MKLLYLSLILLFSSSAFVPAWPSPEEESKSSIVFSTVGRSSYAFDVYSVPIAVRASADRLLAGGESLLTDGESVNFNGHFPSDPSRLLSLFPGLPPPHGSGALPFVYVTERNGTSTIFLDVVSTPPSAGARFQFHLAPPSGSPSPAMRDRPSVSGDHLVYVSTHERDSGLRQSWAAVYSTHIPTGRTRRLTPGGVADFSPSVSPSGVWTAVASGVWAGEVQELNTSIYIFRTHDGSDRGLVAEHGGWPTWADEETIFFHRRSSDGWWSVYRLTISSTSSVERITPPGSHYFTPASSSSAPGLVAVATRNSRSRFRHIELIDLGRGREASSYIAVTRIINPNAHHYNPFISADHIGYHRCRSGSTPLLENIASPSPDKLSLFRIDGSSPSFSPDGRRIAYTSSTGLRVMNSDGSGEPRDVLNGICFATAWDWRREGVIYTSLGPPLASESTKVDIVSVDLNNDEDGENSEHSMNQLTRGGQNNAFPSPSPDGKWIVFRSGRSGHKNLYIMDSTKGEKAGLQQLTKGPWIDTMCNWSPDGDWIAFASDRHNPGGGGFVIYMVHPNGTGLRRVVHSGDAGQTNHPWFSPDSKRLAFTSDYAGVSGEPIANPQHFKPYGDIFTVKIDGSDIRRLTHNSYEDGTPTWAPIYVKPVDIIQPSNALNPPCNFDDCLWLSVEAAA